MNFLVFGSNVLERKRIIAECILNSNHSIYYNDYIYQNKFRQSIFGSAFSFFYRSINQLILLHKMISTDIAFYTEGVDSSKHLFFLIKIKKKIIVDFYISLYDTYVNDRKLIKPGSKKAEILRNLDRKAIIKSSIVSFLNESEARYYSDLAGVDLSEINYRIIPLFKKQMETVDKSFFKGEKSHLNLCWWGTYIPLHGLNKIINAIFILNKNNFPCKLFIFGDSEVKALEHRRLIKELQLTDVVIVNNDMSFKNGRLMPFLRENCDIALGTFGDSEKAKTVITNKEIDSVSMQVPLITGFSEGLKEYFNGYNDIYMIENTAEALANKIIEVSHLNMSSICENVNRAFEVYKKHFSEENFKKLINDLLTDLENL